MKVLAPLGYDLVLEVASEETGGHSHAGFGAGAKPQFWIGSGKPVRGQVHFAFTAKDRAAVRALSSGRAESRRQGQRRPGTTPHYHQNYFGAFVLDPDGHNIEAVCLPARVIISPR